MYRVLQKILAEGGVQSLWRGNLINCMKVGPESAIRLFTFEQVSHQMFVILKRMKIYLFTKRGGSGKIRSWWESILCQKETYLFLLN